MRSFPAVRFGPLLLLAMMCGCGGGSGSSTDTVAAPPAQEGQQGLNPELPASPPPAPPSPPRYPAAQSVTKQPMDPVMPMPTYLVSAPIAGLETSIMRITDASLGERGIIRHAYSKRQPWNADGSLLLLAFRTPAHLMNGRTFAPLGPLEVPGDPVWSNSDPDVLYGVSGSSFVSFSIATRRQTFLRTFEGYSRVFIGGGEGNLSDDDRYVALIGQRDGGVDVIVYDIPDDAIVATMALNDFTGPFGDLDMATVSPSGRYVLLGVTRPRQAYELHDLRSMKHLRTLVSRQLSHADIGYTAEGKEALITTSDGVSAFYSIGLDDGTQREELSEAHMGWNQHVSCRNSKRPGWCYVSTFWNSERRDAYLFRQIFALKLDGSGTIERFAPANFSDGPTRLLYDRQAHAVPNREGNLVIFASDWGNASALAPIHTYVAGVEVPPR